MNNEGQRDYKEKESVIEEALEDVEVHSAEFPRVNLIEQLHKNERLEHNRIQGTFVRRIVEGKARVGIAVQELLCCVEGRIRGEWQSKDRLTEEQDDQQYSDLVNALTNDIAPHGWIHDFVKARLGLSVKQLI